MPYIEVWVDEADCDCGPCAECERRLLDDAEDDRLIAEVVAEWVRCHRWGDYSTFDEYLERIAAKEYRHVLYGDLRAPPPKKPEASA